ncbi:hypothetical protein PROFUN_09442 [Planoprotostelium fungivorum]|uniref:Uncharacterized protein n=1 Tax=Planoprotostelium fungivorum TaxID=1890364 RepID=A0A2P6NH01_9EUKA|nr:hypothetical protein PROFUN_09442 [Planoprotostelium fungivorum]
MKRVLGRDVTADDFDEFSDDELSPEELQMTVATELTLRWIYDQVKAGNHKPVTKRAFFDGMSPHCALNRYVSPRDIISFLQVQKLITVHNDTRDITFHRAAIASVDPTHGLDITQETKDLLSRSSLTSNSVSNFDDLVQACTKTIFWLQQNTSVPSNYHEFAHQLTPFCSVRRFVSEQRVMDKMVDSELIFVVEGARITHRGSEEARRMERMSRDKTYTNQIRNIRREAETTSQVSRDGEREEMVSREDPEWTTFVVISPKGEY